jgi:glycosyltransferase involved in cell wall biosynthesis
MHILHVIDTLMIGGAERMLIEIANASVRRGYKVSVCITRKNGPLNQMLDCRINVYVMNRKKKFDFSGITFFSKLLREIHPDILHVHGRSSCSLILFYCKLLNNNLPLIFHDHYGRIIVNKEIPFWFRYYGYRRINYYIAPFEELREWALKAKIPSQKILIINNAIHINHRIKKEHRRIEKDELIGIFVAGIRIEKGFHILIEALSRMRMKKNLKIYIVGGVRDNDYYLSCLQTAQRSGVLPNLILLGERKDVPRLLSEVDFGIIPSLWESGPLVLIEYIAFGLPVIYTKVGGISRKAEELQIPGAISPDNVEEIQYELEKMMKSSVEERYIRGLISRQAAIEAFNIDKQIEKFFSIYQTIL